MKNAFLIASCVLAGSMLLGCQSAGKAGGPAGSIAAAPSGNPVQLGDFEGVDNLYVDGPVYIASQPSAEALRAFADEGVTVVVNFRTDGEMDKLDFDEPGLLAQEGLDYVHIPIGAGNRYTPEALAAFAEAMETHEGKALLHCRSGGRVTNFYVAYLVKYRGYDLEDAYEVGLKLRYRPSPLEQLLGRKIGYHFES